MTKEELYLKTIFCCIACDGDIATEEVDMVKDLCAKDNIFHDVDSEKYLNSWITEINEQGALFLQSYLKELKSVVLNETVLKTEDIHPPKTGISVHFSGSLV